MDAKSLSNMKMNELRKIAETYGIERKRLYGCSKPALVYMILKLK